ncbi:MAG: UMUC domain-containing protein DNA-repair protein [Porticoccaceae bacterium]
MFALIDCHDFHASCERIFRPDLRGRPLVVVADNGQIIARSAEARALGIPDRARAAGIEHRLRRHGVAVLDADHQLYGDLFRRVMASLHSLHGTFEVAGLDRLFVALDGGDPVAEAQQIRQTLWRALRIPSAIGIGPTRTLARLATRLARQAPACEGVCLLDGEYKWRWLLARTPIRQLPGIGPDEAAPLAAVGIHSALDLALAEGHRLRHPGSRRLASLIEELNGRPGLALGEMPDSRWRIHRTEARPLRARSAVALEEAVAHQASGAAATLAARHQRAGAVHVFVHPAPGETWPPCASALARLPGPGNDPGAIVAVARQLAGGLFQPGKGSCMVGAGLLDIVDGEYRGVDGACKGIDGGHGQRLGLARAPGHRRTAGGDRMVSARAR